MWTFLPAILMNIAGGLAFQCRSSAVNFIGGILLMPDLILGLVTMGALPPAGLALCSVLGWALVIHLLIRMIEPLVEAVKRHTR